MHVWEKWALVSRIVASHKPMLGSVMSEERLLAILRAQDAKRDAAQA